MDLSQWIPMSPFAGPPFPKKYGIVWPWNKGAPVPGAFTIEIVDNSTGKAVGKLASGEVKLASVNLIEGGTYSVQVTTKNTSTKAGTPWPATLSLTIAATAGSTQLIAPNPTAYNYAAGESKTTSFTLVVPLGLGAATGQLTANFTDPNGVSLGTGTLSLTVVAVPVGYGASVAISGPGTLMEGQNYTFQVAVTNSSAKGGQAWPAAMSLAVSASAGSTQLLYGSPASYSYAAGEGRGFTFTFAIPLGLGGSTCQIVATLTDPSGAAVPNAAVTQSPTIGTVPVSYAGTVGVAGQGSTLDLNGDGKADNLDLQLLQKMIAGMWTDPAVVAAIAYWGSQSKLLAAADFNGDGKFNAGDITSWEIKTGISA